MTSVQNFEGPVTCHAWNKNCSQIALSLNDSEFGIYQHNNNGMYDEIHTLSEHSQRVTSIDWAAQSNQIVTCGADRNAYVWNFNGQAWKPTLVILRINRAATFVKWSPKENKFAVGSASKLISICYFDKEHDWWISKHIKKGIKSTVSSIDWHPNNILLASGSSDFKTRIYSSYVKEIDLEKPSESEWGKKMTFGNQLVEFHNSGWVHCVAFSPDGHKLAWIGHDACISVVNSSNSNVVASIKTNFLPFTTCLWASNSSLIIAGHDCVPMLYLYKDQQNQLDFITKLDIEQENAEGKKFSAMKLFQNRDKRALDADEETVVINTTHKNTINQLVKYNMSPNGKLTAFSSCGVDGALVIWNFKNLEAKIHDLKIE